MKYYCEFEDGNDFAVGISIQENPNTVPAPEGFNPEIHSIRRMGDGSLILATHKEREEYDQPRIEAAVQKSKAKREAAAKKSK